MLAVVLAAAIGGWYAFKYFLNVDRFRPLAAQQLERVTGLPATIEGLDLALLPTPSVTAKGVTVGKGALRVRVEKVTAQLRLDRLLKREVDVSQVGLFGLDLVLPKDLSLLQEHLAARGAPSGAASGAGLPVDLSVDHVYARDAVVRFGEMPEPFAIGTIDLRDVLEDVISARLALRLPALGQEASVEADGTVRRPSQNAAIEVEGRAEVQHIELDELVDYAQTPSVSVDADAQVSYTMGESPRAEVSGSLEPVKGASDQAQALAGDFTATAWWLDGAVVLNDVRLTAEGGEVRADVTRQKDGAVACEVEEATVNATGLAPVLAMVQRGAFRFSAQPGAALTARELLVGLDGEGVLRLAKGAVEFSGIDLVLADGKTAFGGIHGSARVEENAFVLERATAEGVALAGTLEPDWGNGEIAFELSGEVGLTRERVAMFVDVGPLQELGGTLRLARIAGTVVSGEAWPRDLVVEGTVTQGRAAVAVPHYAETFTEIEGRVAADADTLRTAATGRSTQLGAVSVDGRYTFASRVWEGTATGDITSLSLPFAGESAQGQVVRAALEAYGASQFRVTVDLSALASERVKVHLAREGKRALTLEALLVMQGEAWGLGSVSASAIVPARALGPVMPDAARVDGDVLVRFEHPEAQPDFTLCADVTACAIGIGETLRKKPEDPLTVRVTGAVSEEGWTPHALDVAYEGQTIEARFERGRLVADRVAIDVAPLSGLLPAGASTSGRITGTFATGPVEADLVLHEVGLKLLDEAAVDAVNGAVAYHDGAWTCKALTIRGPNSECMVDASYRGSKWQGRIGGRQLDVNALLPVWRTAAAFRSAAETHTAPQMRKAPGPPASPITGTFEIDLGSVFFRRGRLDDVRAQAVVNGDRLEVRNLSLRPYAGSVQGRIDIAAPGEDAARMVTADLQLDQVDARIVDELGFEEPRGFAGTIDGTVQLVFPVGAGLDPLDHMSGSIVFHGRNGTFGKFGMTTKLLTALRATEVFRLRLPTFRDEGLVYDTCHGSLALEDGVMTLDHMEIESPTLRISAKGTVDFPQDATNVECQVALLGAVTGIMEVIGLDKVAKDVREHSGFHATVTGPPRDPEVRLSGGRAAKRVREGVKTGEEAVRDAVVDAASEALRKVLGH